MMEDEGPDWRVAHPFALGLCVTLIYECPTPSATTGDPPFRG